MNNNINDNILENFDKNMLSKHIAPNSSYHRRHFHLIHEQTIGKMHYTVLSAFPTQKAEPVTDKIAYLISSEKVNKKLSGLVRGDTV